MSMQMCPRGTLVCCYDKTAETDLSLFHCKCHLFDSNCCHLSPCWLAHGNNGEGERERERQRQRERERERDRQTDRQTHRHTAKEREIEGRGEGETERLTDRSMD